MDLEKSAGAGGAGGFGKLLGQPKSNHTSESRNRNQFNKSVKFAAISEQDSEHFSESISID
tara:strand:+ start:580 stop:762 length:183 start_codon:yes stop_codon:yes gene_type:complete